MDRMVGVHAHRSKLEHGEGLHQLPDALLAEEDRTRRRQLHQSRKHEEERREQREQRQAYRDVERSLGGVVMRRPRVARTCLRHYGINRPNSLRFSALGLGMNVQPNRQATKCLRVQPPGKLATESIVQLAWKRGMRGRNLREDKAD